MSFPAIPAAALPKLSRYCPVPGEAEAFGEAEALALCACAGDAGMSTSVKARKKSDVATRGKKDEFMGQ